MINKIFQQLDCLAYYFFCPVKIFFRSANHLTGRLVEDGRKLDDKNLETQL